MVAPGSDTTTPDAPAALPPAGSKRRSIVTAQRRAKAADERPPGSRPKTPTGAKAAKRAKAAGAKKPGKKAKSQRPAKGKAKHGKAKRNKTTKRSRKAGRKRAR